MNNNSLIGRLISNRLNPSFVTALGVMVIATTPLSCQSAREPESPRQRKKDSWSHHSGHAVDGKVL